MKKDIHPTYYKKTKVTCACGNEFFIGSTKKELETESCSQCHPVYTGQERGAVRGGRIEKFQERLDKKITYQKKSDKNAKKKAKQREKVEKGKK